MTPQETGFLSGPIFALVLYACAVGTAALWLRCFPGLTMPVAAAGSAPDRWRSLDGLRGLLAVGVFVHHFTANYRLQAEGVWGVPNGFANQLGKGSVALFFMTTSFLFFGRLMERRYDMDIRAFLISRLARLCPLYCAVVLMLIAAVFGAQGWTLKEPLGSLLRNIADWTLFTIPGRPDINQVADTALLTAGVTWTLRYEWLFYLLLPLMAVLAHPRQHAVAGLLFVPVLLIFLWLASQGAALETSIGRTFLGGVGAAFWLRRPRLRALASGRTAAVIFFGSVGMMLFGFESAFDLPALALLTVIFTIAAADNCWLGWLLAKPVQWLGSISYSVYLLHGLTLWAGSMAVKNLWGGFGERWWAHAAFGCVAACLLVAAASCTFGAIERPFIALFRKGPVERAALRKCE